MKKSITPNQIRENNRNLIYQYIYRKEKVSQQDIAYDLHLSRPTVTTNLSSLEEDGLINKNGQIDTEYVGRKASAYTIVPDFRVGIGVEILKKEVKMIIVDLYGKKIERSVFEISYKDEDSYFEQVTSQILSFKDSVGIRDEQILGIGFAMQGLVSPDSQTMLYGKILECTGLSINVFTRYLPYPCSFIHDADNAAISELWISPELKDACYLSLSKHLGASLIINREIITGKHGHNSTIEHVPMEPKGRLCYCGKHGCMETLCSLDALLNDVETLDSFFAKVRNREESESKRWQEYLSHLARSINLLHLIYDQDFILGGYLAPYLQEKDLSYIHEEIRRMTPFSENQDFLHISKMPKHNITIGAALPYIQKFLNM